MPRTKFRPRKGGVPCYQDVAHLHQKLFIEHITESHCFYINLYNTLMVQIMATDTTRTWHNDQSTYKK